MKITVYQDTICPWCYVGKKFLKEALENWEGDTSSIKIEYKSFFLDPNTPKEGKDPEGHLEKKYGKQKAERMRERLIKIGKEAGIDFNFSESVRIPNTELSHQLVKFYPDNQDELLEAIFNAYFIERKNIGQIDVLVEIAENLDLQTENLKQKLQNEEALKEVHQDFREAKKSGVRGVPFFVFNDEVALQGAQRPNMILQTMKRVDNRESIQLDINQNL